MNMHDLPAFPALKEFAMRYYPAALALSLLVGVTASVGDAETPAPLDPRAAALIAEGQAKLAAGEVQSAIGAYEAALTIAPGQPAIYLRLAEAARREGLQGKAIHYYRAALEREPPVQVPVGRLLRDHPGALLAGSAGVVSTYTLFYLATAFALAQGAGPLGYPREAFPGFAAVGRYVVVATPGILLIGMIFGGVRSGVFTATESSCVAVVYAILVTILVYRQLTWTAFVEATLGAVRTTAMVLLVIGAAGSFGWLMAFLQVPQATIAAMKAVSDNPIVILLMINLILLVLGTFMDMAPMIIICTPIFLPVVKAFGVDPVHFGVILILNAGIGLNTPPVGSVQFVACAIGRISIGESMRTIWPFYGASVAVLLLVTYLPGLSLWLPRLFH